MAYNYVLFDFAVQNSKQYNSTKYQMVDLSDSFEAKMLESLRRQAMEGGSDSDSDDASRNAKPAKSLSRFKYGDDSGSDSSDDASESKAQVCGFFFFAESSIVTIR